MMRLANCNSKKVANVSFFRGYFVSFCIKIDISAFKSVCYAQKKLRNTFSEWLLEYIFDDFVIIFRQGINNEYVTRPFFQNLRKCFIQYVKEHNLRSIC
jgi:predicted metal-dependent phosphotriesterase family hydrolase